MHRCSGFPFHLKVLKLQKASTARLPTSLMQLHLKLDLLACLGLLPALNLTVLLLCCHKAKV